MCGLAGSVLWTCPDRDAELHSVRRMTDALVHRGPDAGAVRRFGEAVLGHRRLSIIDVATSANQPMVDPDSGLAIVFNGEIYNFREIRRDLEALGERFVTHGDTEVLLRAFARWGKSCLERLVGMFAFAVWDGKARRLTLARDRLGKKPLYYRLTSEGVVFASELPALRLHPDVAGEPDPAALGQYLSLGYILGRRSALSEVRRLPAAHVLSVEAGGDAVVERYWDLAPHFREKRAFASLDDGLDALAAALDDAVRLRLVADVPLGAFLSAGLDSALIAEAMARVGRGGVEGFTIGFDERGFDESRGAAETASHLGVNHHVETVAAEGLASSLPAMVAAAGEPFADTSMIPVHRLAGFARRSVTVALSGDGGDELFAGYVTYSADRLHAMSRALPSWLVGGLRAAMSLVPPSGAKVGWDYKLRQFLAGHGFSPERAHYSWRTLFSDEAKRALVRPDRRDAVCGPDPFEEFQAHFSETAGCAFLDRAMYVDIKTWLVDDILLKVDRMTMAGSLEARAPLLDHRVVELAASLPVDWKMRGFDKKFMLKRLARRRLRPEILSRRKQGFNAPVAAWLRGDLRDLGRDATLSAAMSEWLVPAEVERLWQEHLSGRKDHGFRLFALTCLGLWLAG